MRRVVAAGLLVAVCLAVPAMVGCSSSEESRKQLDDRDAEIMRLKSENDQLSIRVRGLQTAVQELQRKDVAPKPVAVAEKPVSKPVVAKTVSIDDVAAALKAKGLTVEQSGNELAIVIQTTGVFEKGKLTAVSKKGAETLKAIADVLKKECGERSVRIEGHTDNTPITKESTKKLYPTNQELSVARAKAVFDYMTGKLGISDENITTKGLGDTKPRKDNGTEEGQAANRRVEIVIVF
jgi:flagellar motor protein MotB